MTIDGVEYFLASDVARYFEVEQYVVRRWVADGKLIPSDLKYKNANLFLKDEVVRFAREKYGNANTGN